MIASDDDACFTPFFHAEQEAVEEFLRHGIFHRQHLLQLVDVDMTQGVSQEHSTRVRFDCPGNGRATPSTEYLHSLTTQHCTMWCGAVMREQKLMGNCTCVKTLLGTVDILTIATTSDCTTVQIWSSIHSLSIMFTQTKTPSHCLSLTLEG